jgi:hypothetical protein
MEQSNPNQKTQMKIATFTPHNPKRHSAVSGAFIEFINGGAGAHIFCPTPNDPYKVVRVWELDGTITVTGEDDPAPTLAAKQKPAPTLPPLESGCLGLSWDEIERKQGGKLNRNNK